MSEVKKTLKVGSKEYSYYSLKEAKAKGLGDIDKLPKSLKVLLENLLRHENGTTVVWDDIKAINDWTKTKSLIARLRIIQLALLCKTLLVYQQLLI